MIEFSSKRRSIRRSVAFALFALIVLLYGVLEVLSSGPVSDSTIVSSAGFVRVAPDEASLKRERQRDLRSDGLVHESR
jgi:hypothetical protein